MKKIFIICLVITSFISCKKQKATNCDITMASISGNYKFTKLEKVAYSTGETQDITSTLTSCDLSGIYTFKTDSTVTYTESTNCNGNGIGTWNLPGTFMYTTFASGNGNRINATLIESWNCFNLVLLTRYPSVTYNYRFTLARFQY